MQKGWLRVGDDGQASLGQVLGGLLEQVVGGDEERLEAGGLPS